MDCDEIKLDQIWGIHISVFHARSVGQAASWRTLSGDGADGHSPAMQQPHGISATSKEWAKREPALDLVCNP
jgi:hypothetical protein